MKKLLLIIILNSTFLILHSFSFAQNRTIDSLITLLKNDKSDTNKVKHLNKLSWEFKEIGNYDTSLLYSNNALQLSQKFNYAQGIANAYSLIGNVYDYQGDYPRALEFYLKALKLDEEQKNKKGVAKRLGNIGIVYYEQGDITKALDYYFMALKMDEELGDKIGMSIDLGNIGSIYVEKGDYSKAMEYLHKALKMKVKLGDKSGIASTLSNIGGVYHVQADYPKAMDYYFKAMRIQEELGNKNGLAMTIGSIGSLYTETGKFKEAEEYLKKGIVLDNSIGAFGDLRQAEELLSHLYDTTGRHKQALYHYKKAMAIKDTLFSQENKKQLVRKEMNFEFDKKEAVTKAGHEKEMAVVEAEKKKQQFILILVSCFLFLVFLFLSFIFRTLRITRRQKNIIVLQKNEVSRQKEIAESQKEKIIDSITYAQRIQQSILIEETEIQNYLPDSFIYYEPKDIVSGDFYWCSKIDDKIILAALDCTGHGVPGAFMSMIGNTLLNQIVNEKNITKPSEILRLLNQGVYEALHQRKYGVLSRDGMDVALCCVDYKNMEIQFAGAQNPLYLVSDNEVVVIKGDMQTVGGGGLIPNKGDAMKIKYTNNIFPIKKGMSIYLFSDGYMDQFGGSDRKKFGIQKFKELLLNNQGLSMQQQKEIITSAHQEWKRNTAQTDDILVIGVRI